MATAPTLVVAEMMNMMIIWYRAACMKKLKVARISSASAFTAQIGLHIPQFILKPLSACLDLRLAMNKVFSSCENPIPLCYGKIKGIHATKSFDSLVPPVNDVHTWLGSEPDNICPVIMPAPAGRLQHTQLVLSSAEASPDISHHARTALAT